MILSNREKLIKRINEHLRITARQLVMFDTEEETLQFLVDTFLSELTCDFVAIVLKDDEYLWTKLIHGASSSFGESFPLKISDCTPKLLKKGLTFQRSEIDRSCKLSLLLLKENIRAWFTVPVEENDIVLGCCIIGFQKDVTLYQEMNKPFNDFGKDVAIAIKLAQQKEAQKQKMIGFEWINQHLSLDSPLEAVVENIVEQAGKGTKSRLSNIYLYDERENSLIFQPPCFGDFFHPQKIMMKYNNNLKDFFPYLGTPGGDELSINLTMNLKTIGVLHVEKKSINKGMYTKDDLKFLEFIASHVAAMIENGRLYQNEKNHKKRLHSLLEFQQALVKETVLQENFDGITETISNLFSKNVILLDRFMRPISYHLLHSLQSHLASIVYQSSQTVNGNKIQKEWFTHIETLKTSFSIWPVNSGEDVLGYIIIDSSKEEMDDFFRLSIDIALNIFSLQFIKQKLIFHAKEQVKDSFIHRLFVPHIEDREQIIQYANLFKWNLFQFHRIAILKILFSDNKESEDEILKIQEKKSALFEQLKERIADIDQDILFGSRTDEFILIVPIEKEQNNPRKYWSRLFSYIKKTSLIPSASTKYFLGVGGITDQIDEYNTCYQYAEQALLILFNQHNRDGFAIFDELGAYPLLYQLKDKSNSHLFVKKYLGPILTYSDSKNMDLFRTLRSYLRNNGSIKETSEELYIHRSTLQYRIDKIESILKVDLIDSEQRFNLMLACKLYDLIPDFSL